MRRKLYIIIMALILIGCNSDGNNDSESSFIINDDLTGVWVETSPTFSLESYWYHLSDKGNKVVVSPCFQPQPEKNEYQRVGNNLVSTLTNFDKLQINSSEKISIAIDESRYLIKINNDNEFNFGRISLDISEFETYSNINSFCALYSTFNDNVGTTAYLDLTVFNNAKLSEIRLRFKDKAIIGTHDLSNNDFHISISGEYMNQYDSDSGWLICEQYVSGDLYCQFSMDDVYVENTIVGDFTIKSIYLPSTLK